MPSDVLHRHSERESDVLIRSGADFCARYFPKDHAAGTCPCKPPPPQAVLVIRSRHA